MTRYHKFCKYCEEEFTSEILAKEHLFSCAYDEVILPMPDNMENEDSDIHPLYKWVSGELTIDDIDGYTHEIVKPELGNWIITDKGAERIKEVTQLEECSVTWELTEE